jgi:hypothetical protein
VQFPHPDHGRLVTVEAPYDAAFAQAVEKLAGRG